MRNLMISNSTTEPHRTAPAGEIVRRRLQVSAVKMLSLVHAENMTEKNKAKNENLLYTMISIKRYQGPYKKISSIVC
jgi:hypothetical protein